MCGRDTLKCLHDHHSRLAGPAQPAVGAVEAVHRPRSWEGRPELYSCIALLHALFGSSHVMDCV